MRREALAVSLLAACGRIGFQGSGHADELDGPAQLGAFSTPRLVTELSDPTAVDGTPSLTGDLLEIFFKSTRAGGQGGEDIWHSTRTTTSSPWSTPAPVTELNTSTYDTSPEVAKDGLTLWFTSDRSGNRDLYVTTRPTRTASWSPPSPVAELDSTGRDDAISVTTSGLVAYFDSDRGGGNLAIYRSQRASVTAPWSTPQLVLSDPGADLENPWVSADELTLYYASNPTGSMAFDIYVVTRRTTAEPFGTPTLVASLNSPQWDDDPWLTDDQRYVIFTSNRVDGGQQWDLYEASR